jgi:UDP-N-acetylmuramoylalanine--D-glutamate ligase
MIFSTRERKIPGDHNLENITAVIALADTLKIPMEILQDTIRNFNGLPHRLQEL